MHSTNLVILTIILLTDKLQRVKILLIHFCVCLFTALQAIHIQHFPFFSIITPGENTHFARNFLVGKYQFTYSVLH